MAGPAPRPAPPTPLLAAGLLGGGLAALAAGAWLGRIDFAGFVERQVARAHGTLSAETAAWLRAGHFPDRLLLAGFVLAGLGLAGFFLRPTLARLGERWARGHPGPAEYATALLGVVAWYFPTLTGGYFRYDDFALLTVAQEGDFWTTLWQPHGDHVLPLTRVLAWAGLHLFGVAALPYNLWLWLCLGGVVGAGLGLLGELGCGRPARAVFAVLVVGWSPWAEMMTGYYILSTYFVIAFLGLAAAWLYLRWRRTGRPAAVAGFTACVLLAPLVDLSGGYVPGLAAVFLAHDWLGRRAGGFRAWARANRAALAGLVGATAASGLFLLYAYRVVNPGVFLSMAAGEERSLFQVARDLGYLLASGTLLSLATPFVYARLPVLLLGGLTLAAVAIAGVGFLAAVRAADPARRRLLGALTLVVLGTGLMVVLGRPPADTWVVRWAAKHLCPVYVWAGLLVAAGWDARWTAAVGARRTLLAEGTALALVGFVVLQAGFGQLGLAVAFPPFGYPAELRDAGRRREAVAFLRDEVAGRLAARLGPTAVVPTLDGAVLEQRHPSLFHYNLSHYRPFLGEAAAGLTWVRTAAMQSWHAAGVRTVPDLRAAVTPGTARLLADDPVLRALYFAEVPLEAQPVSGGRPADASRAAGGARVGVRAGVWDPATAGRLQLGTDGPVTGPVAITIEFWSELLQADWRGTVMLPPGPAAAVEVDLRQAGAFALSPRVANLRVRLPGGVGGWFRLAESAP